MELFQSGYGLLAAVFVLGTAVFVHELGHFLAAKLSGMRAQEFAFGFGPQLLGVRRGETVYSLRAIPFGGFVRIAGMEPGEDGTDAERGFYTRPRYHQLSVLFAGPAMNVLLGIVVFVAVCSIWGMAIAEIRPPLVEKVMAGTPAEAAGIQAGDTIEALDGETKGLRLAEVVPGSTAAKAGLRAGDRIWEANDRELAVAPDLRRVALQAAGSDVALEVTHQDVDPDTARPKESGKPRTVRLRAPDQEQLGHQRFDLCDDWGLQFGPIGPTDMAIYIQQRPERPVRLRLRRADGRLEEITVVPASKWMREPYETPDGKQATRRVKAGRVGVVFAYVRQYPGMVEAARYGLKASALFLADIVVGLWQMLSGQAAVEVAGPLGMAAMAAESAKLGLEAVLDFAGLISINLAIVNLLPLPITDGGRALIVGYEAIVRRRVGRKQEVALLIGGLAVVVLLFIGITLQDVINLALHGSP